MTDLEKLEYVMKYYDSEILLQELFNVVKDNPEAKYWLQDVYRGSPEPEDEDSEALSAYDRNPGWRNW